MAKQSAGILLYRNKGKDTEVFLVHPGGPFFKNKDLGSWSIPKGEIDDEEDPLLAAQREFTEETGQVLKGHFKALQPIKQKGGKIVQAWAIAGDIDQSKIVSNTFEIAWPPRSGKKQTFPEIDRAEWFTLEQAREKINEMQRKLLEELSEVLKK